MYDNVSTRMSARNRMAYIPELRNSLGKKWSPTN